jgi:hypothetical protein
MDTDYEAHLVLKWLYHHGFYKTAMVFEEESDASLHGYSGKMRLIRDMCFGGDFDKLIELSCEIFPEDNILRGMILCQQLREELKKVSTRGEMSAFVERLTRNRDFLPGQTYWSFVDAATVGAPKDHKVFSRWRGESDRYDLFRDIVDKLEPLFPNCIEPIALRDYPDDPLSKALQEYAQNHENELESLFQVVPFSAPRRSGSTSPRRVQLVKHSEFVDPNSGAQPIRAATFSNSGSYVAVGTNNHSIVLANSPELEVISQSTKLHAGSVYSLAWSSDDRLIATGSNDQLIRITPVSKLNGNSSDKSIRLQLQLGTPRSVIFSPSAPGNIIAGFSMDAVVREIDYTSGVVVNRYDCKQVDSNVNSLSVRGHYLLAASSSGQVCLFDSRNSQEIIWSHSTSERKVPAVADITCDGHYVATGDGTGHVAVWDLRHRKNSVWTDSKMHTESVRSVKFNFGGTRLATASFDKTVKVVESFATSNDSYVLEGGHTDRVVGLDWSKDDRFLVSSGTDSRVVLYS